MAFDFSEEQTAKRSLDYIKGSDRQSLSCSFPKTFNGVEVRCHTCEPCRRFKRWKIKKKLRFEAACSPRTWFVTLTVRRSAGYHHVSALLKRWRAAASRHGCTIRFFAAEERGDLRGRLHWHVLLFLSKELPRRVLAEKRVWVKQDGKRKRISVRRWSKGFQHWVLAKNPAAYVSKCLGYVAKGGRFKGSNFLGTLRAQPELQSHDMVAQLRAMFPGARILSVGKQTPWHHPTDDPPHVPDWELNRAIWREIDESREAPASWGPEAMPEGFVPYGDGRRET